MPAGVLAGIVTTPVFVSKVGTLPPLIGVAGTTLVIVTVPPDPAVGLVPPKLSLSSTLIVV